MSAPAPPAASSTTDAAVAPARPALPRNLEPRVATVEAGADAPTVEPAGRGGVRTETVLVARCAACSAVVLAALDVDEGHRAVVDPTALTAAGEAWHLLNRRNTYRLGGVMHFTLMRRDEWIIERQSAGSPPDIQGAVTILPEHRCGISTPAAFLQN